MYLLIFLAVAMIFVYLVNRYEYHNSNYKDLTGNTYNEVMNDKGKYGEFLTVEELERFDIEHRMAVNVYIPKNDHETTEIDVIYICPYGVFVIESKNYSGWIYGDESHRYWTQVYSGNKKEKFYNPVFQNKTHIKSLAKVLNIHENKMKSLIVFSEKCTLKIGTIKSNDVYVFNRKDLAKILKTVIKNSPEILSKDEIQEIYSKLKKYTNASEEIKNDENLYFGEKD